MSMEVTMQPDPTNALGMMQTGASHSLPAPTFEDSSKVARSQPYFAGSVHVEDSSSQATQPSLEELAEAASQSPVTKKGGRSASLSGGSVLEAEMPACRASLRQKHCSQSRANRRGGDGGSGAKREVLGEGVTSGEGGGGGCEIGAERPSLVKFQAFQKAEGEGVLGRTKMHISRRNRVDAVPTKILALPAPASFSPARRISHLSISPRALSGDMGLSFRQAMGLPGSQYPRLKHLLRTSKTTDINSLNKSGASALHIAVWSGKGLEALKLVEHGAKVNTQDKFGLTPLHLAVWNNHLSALSVLLQSGADVNLRAKIKSGETHSSLTPLHFALVRKNKLMANMLLLACNHMTIPTAEGTKLNRISSLSSFENLGDGSSSLSESELFRLIEKTCERFVHGLIEECGL
eukprot:CAMPEP_0196588602 /NCGR_PEP_ID=MMETSP1081-20130531/61048_1 /TAXON_ID=36882 /ORGANISM="Pyramimonas amylifera, Strain CCMP720" /LENGTH=405 /DNA_ID=CAMNT_0041911137 /DNA_START=643 /DNA_END=1860 /DNA_ORIENTATION=-